MMSEIQALISGNIYAFLIVFTRIGAAFMMMPLLGDRVIPTNIRLLIALGFSLVFTPVVWPLVGQMPDSTALLTLLLCKEVLIGAFIGLIARAIFSALNTAGMVISYKMSLANASMFNPQMSEQSTVVAAVITMAAAVLMFTMNIHHILIAGVYHSYSLFPPMDDIIINDFAVSVADAVNESFIIALEFSAPFIIISFAMQLALGVIARLIPQIQVFFLGIPIQVMVGVITIYATISMCLFYFINRFEGYFIGMFG